MSESKKSKLNQKVVIPVAVATVILAGAGFGGCKYVQLSLDDKTKQEVVDKVGKENNETNDNSNNEENTNENNDETNDNEDNDELNNDSEDNEVVINRSEDGKITFTKKEDDSSVVRGYAHLIDVVEKKAQEDSVILVLGDDKPKFEKDDDKLGDGLLASTDKNQLPPKVDKDKAEETVKPEVPSEPEVPAEPSNPVIPVDPETPVEPETPTEPEVPSEPETPTEPEIPVDPEEPEAPAVDKADLNNLIGKASTYNSSRYTDKSWDKLSNVVAEGKKVNDNKKSTQSQVDKVADRINKAIQDLVIKSPTITVEGLDMLEDNVSTEEVINIKVASVDVDGNKLKSKVTLNGEEIEESDGSYELNLLEGANVLEINTKDSFGGQSKEKHEIVYEKEEDQTEAPIITVDGLDSDNVLEGNLAFTVDSTDNEGNTINSTVLFNGADITNDLGQYDVELAVGENIFEIRSEDSNGAYTTKVVVIEHEIEDAVLLLNVIGVDEGNIVDGHLSIGIEASTNNNESVLLDVTNNGVEINSQDGQYNIELSEGENVIVVEALSEGGVYTKETYTIVYESEATDDIETDDTEDESDQTDETSSDDSEESNDEKDE